MKKVPLYLVFVFAVSVLFFFTGLVTAAEKATPHANQAAPAKAAVRTGPKAQPQRGGVLRHIEPVGHKAPFGWPLESWSTMLESKPVCIEALVRLNPEGKPVPWLATSWKVAPDKSSITFYLRKGVKFHDGTDFNAEAAKWNLEAVRGKKVGTEAWTSIDIIDNYTIRIGLSNYANDLLSILAGRDAVGTMISPTAFNKNGIEWVRWHPVGTGPFEFVSFEREVNTKYKRFEDYWQKGKPYLDGIEYIYIKDPMTQFAAMQAGEGHVLEIETGKIAADFKASGQFNVHTQDAGTNVLIPDSMNSDSPFSNRKVREAVEYAINKDAIVNAKGYGFWQAAYQIPCATGIGYVKNFQGRRYNPAKAKQLLKEAGYPNGFKTRIIPHFAIDRDVAVSVQSFLAAAGIQAELEFVDQQKYINYRKKGWKNALLFHGMAVYSDYLKNLEGYVASGDLDFPSLKEPAELPKLFKEARSTVKVELPKVQMILKTLYDDVTIIPVHTVGRASIEQKKMHDSDHLNLGMLSDWRPENTWLSK
jgi:peptide/nickel transport system substrate-binding protein